MLADWRAGVLTTYALLLLLLLCCREEREQRRADIEHLAGSLVNKVNECVAAIDEGACTASQKRDHLHPWTYVLQLCVYGCTLSLQCCQDSACSWLGRARVCATAVLIGVC